MPPIIVKFTRRNIKESLYKARRLLKGFSTKDIGYVRENNIFITESLTSKNKELFKEAYKAKKEKDFKFIWNEMKPLQSLKSTVSAMFKKLNNI
jgi:hypothetical protein